MVSMHHGTFLRRMTDTTGGGATSVMNLAGAATCAFAMIVDEMTNTNNKTVVSLLAPVLLCIYTYTSCQLHDVL